MTTSSLRTRLLASSLLFGLTAGAVAIGLAPSVALAQAKAPAATEEPAQLEEITVTGSRIRRSASETSAPVLSVDAQVFSDRGYDNAAEALNRVTGNIPALGQNTSSDSATVVTGQQLPNLFNLGTGRTLTLINGRRAVPSIKGLDGSAVDTNIIPVGLIQRIEVVEAGGAAVYGSDAIAGVINYVLKDKFQGVEMNVRAGISDRSDYKTKSARITAGQNFAGGRGNIAADISYSQTPRLAYADRSELTNLPSGILATNPASTSSTDGIPDFVGVLNPAFFSFNANGVVSTSAVGLSRSQLLRQFTADGSTTTAYNSGTGTYGGVFASGGDGYRLSDLSDLRTGVKRTTANVVGHYDITDHVKFSTELTFARTNSRFKDQAQYAVGFSDAGLSIPFNRTNPYLSASAIADLDTASATFRNGGNLFLLKALTDLSPDPLTHIKTDTKRGVFALSGDFDAADRNFYWSTALTYGRVRGAQRSYDVIPANFNKAANVVKNASGQAVCAVNADAITTNDDAACAPINAFGQGNISDAAKAYATSRIGNTYTNDEVDFLATIGGSLFKVPAGEVKFSAAYEHRFDKASFSAFAEKAGTFEVPAASDSGKYHTDELSGELLVPVIGGDFTLPGVQKLELSGAYRFVDNSIAGRESVWNAGARWEVIDGFSVRGSRSRNFRAPTLAQFLSPATTRASAVSDPCDNRRINSGPNPTVRRANCLALFTAHPEYGTGATAEARLASFTNDSQNTTRATLTTSGNRSLENEISNTWTYGFVLQPRFIPRLTITADRLDIKLANGLTSFDQNAFAAACYDIASQPADICSTITRAGVGNAQGVAPGSIIAAIATTKNVATIRYQGEIYNVDYGFELGDLLGGADAGTISLSAELTHNAYYAAANVGEVLVRTDGTAALPHWVGRLDAAWHKGPVRLTYQYYRLSSSKSAYTATADNDFNPVLDAYGVHNVSGQFEFGRYRLSAGIDNLGDELPQDQRFMSFGDLVGRRYWTSFTAKF